jgi:hypothetical protein
MNSPLQSRFDCPETITRASFWRERKWHWMIDAIVFAILGGACAWPIVGAGGAMFELCQRLIL